MPVPGLCVVLSLCPAPGLLFQDGLASLALFLPLQLSPGKICPLNPFLSSCPFYRLSPAFWFSSWGLSFGTCRQVHLIWLTRASLGYRNGLQQGCISLTNTDAASALREIDNSGLKKQNKTLTPTRPTVQQRGTRRAAFSDFSKTEVPPAWNCSNPLENASSRSTSWLVTIIHLELGKEEARECVWKGAYQPLSCSLQGARKPEARVLPWMSTHPHPYSSRLPTPGREEEK